MYDLAIKKRVRKLRKRGYTFKEILEEFPCLGKSTISEWVRDIALTSEQEQRIIQKQLGGRVKLMEYNKKRHQKAVEFAQNIISETKKEIGRINKRDLAIAGAALYWGEGYKKSRNTIEFINSDPKIIILIMKFFGRYAKLKKVSSDAVYSYTQA